MTFPGPGDPETWPAPTGHPHDPRVDDDGDCPACGTALVGTVCRWCGWKPPEPDYESMAEARGWR